MVKVICLIFTQSRWISVGNDNEEQEEEQQPPNILSEMLVFFRCESLYQRLNGQKPDYKPQI